MIINNIVRAIIILLIVNLLPTHLLIAQENSKNEWKAPKEADLIINPITDIPQAIKDGKKTYKQQCVVCHGDKGKGDGVAGLALSPRPASFWSDEFKNQSDGAIFWKISNGKSPMAAYKNMLTEDQRWRVIIYIRNLSK